MSQGENRVSEELILVMEFLPRVGHCPLWSRAHASGRHAPRVYSVQIVHFFHQDSLDVRFDSFGNNSHIRLLSVLITLPMIRQRVTPSMPIPTYSNPS
jgi:hypothetical protein